MREFKRFDRLAKISAIDAEARVVHSRSSINTRGSCKVLESQLSFVPAYPCVFSFSVYCFVLYWNCLQYMVFSRHFTRSFSFFYFHNCHHFFFFCFFVFVFIRLKRPQEGFRRYREICSRYALQDSLVVGILARPLSSVARGFPLSAGSSGGRPLFWIVFCSTAASRLTRGVWVFRWFRRVIGVWGLRLRVERRNFDNTFVEEEELSVCGGGFCMLFGQNKLVLIECCCFFFVFLFLFFFYKL